MASIHWSAQAAFSASSRGVAAAAQVDKESSRASWLAGIAGTIAGLAGEQQSASAECRVVSQADRDSCIFQEHVQPIESSALTRTV